MIFQKFATSCVVGNSEMLHRKSNLVAPGSVVRVAADHEQVAVGGDGAGVGEQTVDQRGGVGAGAAEVGGGCGEVGAGGAAAGDGGEGSAVA